MRVFAIQGSNGTSRLEFHERTPSDTGRPIERFKTRIAQLDLGAEARVYCEDGDHPARFFQAMSESWSGWSGEMDWESRDGSLALTASRDRAGHILIRVRLQSGPFATDWRVEASISAEAGQLEALAQDAAQFFGESAEPALNVPAQGRPTNGP